MPTHDTAYPLASRACLPKNGFFRCAFASLREIFFLVFCMSACGEFPLCQDRCRLPQGEFLAYSGGDQEENDDNLP